MLALLGITEIRRGVEGRNQQSPNFANYDESKVAPYPPLPALMVTKAGKRVTSAKDWWNVRRPEIVELFDREVYGRMPKVTPKVSWTVTATTRGDRRRRDDGEEGAARQGRQQQLPGDRGQHRSGALDAEGRQGPGAGGPGIRIPAAARSRRAPRRRTRPAGPTWQEQVVAKGWGYASIRPASIQADNGAGLTQGIIGLVNKGQPRKVDDWGALQAWAWGTSRLLDYFETDKAVDAKRVAIEGHSRYGKADDRRDGLRAAVRASRSSARPARAARSSCAAPTASWSRTSPRRASTTGWRATSSSTPVR